MTEHTDMVPDEQAPALTAEQARQLHCYTCSNDNAYELRELDEPVAVGDNTVLVHIRAAICRFCGGRLLDLPNQARLDQARSRLERGELTGFEPVGVTYRAP